VAIIELPHLKIGDRLRLSDLARKHFKVPDKEGVVVGLPKSGTQCRVKWDGLKRPQLIHLTYVERADP
jgi:hypothetical protein